MRINFTHDYGLARQGAAFGPAAMMGGTMAMQAAGTAMSAASTIAGGNTAATAGKLQQSADVFQADQLRENEGGAIGAAQRTMLDKQFQTKQMESTLEARGAGGGVNVGVGSPLATEKSIASRGTLSAAHGSLQRPEQSHRHGKRGARPAVFRRRCGVGRRDKEARIAT